MDSVCIVDGYFLPALEMLYFIVTTETAPVVQFDSVLVKHIRPSSSKSAECRFAVFFKHTGVSYGLGSSQRPCVSSILRMTAYWIQSVP